MRKVYQSLWGLSVAICLLVLNSCSNNPYPELNESENTGYFYQTAPPKNLDPQHSYTMLDLRYIFFAYEGLFTYNYFDQLELEPLLATNIPKEIITRDKDGKITEVRYEIELRKGVYFIDDPCFDGGKGREMTAKDFEYSFMRVADSEVKCPIASQFKFIKGMTEQKAKIDEARAELIRAWEVEKDKKFDKEKDYIPSIEIYKEAGQIPGIEITSKYRFNIIMDKRYPQMLYWLAMRFVCAVPYEAVDFYNPTRERTSKVPVKFFMRPVGTGPYQMHWPEFRKDQKVVMVRNENWWGLKADTPVTRFAKQPFTEEDKDKGYWTEEAAGKPLAMMDRMEWYYDKENLTRFNKFMQGYYDNNGIPAEKAGEVLTGTGLSDEMKAQGIKLNRTVEMTIKYIGFNMNNDTVGSPKKFDDPELEANREQSLLRNKKLRQAMSLAINFDEYIKVHLKDMGVNAQSMIPPGVFGYDKNYKHPYKYQDEKSIEKARKLLEEAGYKNGIDPKTGSALELEFTCSTRGPEDRAKMEYFIDSWKRIGLDVKLDSMEYNQFQNKIYGRRFQIFTWGWHADYPDPENFLFLITEQSIPQPNYAHFSHPEFEKYFKLMENMTNDESVMVDVVENGKKVKKKMNRLELIQKCQTVYEDESPWILMYHDVDYLLYHDWLKNVKTHPIMSYPFQYYRLDPKQRQAYREKHNQPVYWPIFVIIILLIGFVTPAIKTYMKERN